MEALWGVREVGEDVRDVNRRKLVWRNTNFLNAQRGRWIRAIEFIFERMNGLVRIG